MMKEHPELSTKKQLANSVGEQLKFPPPLGHQGPTKQRLLQPTG